MPIIGTFGSEAILSSPVPVAISGVTTANPGQVTAFSHGLVSGQQAVVAGVAGATQANGTWAVTVIDVNHFTIPVNVTGTYTSGGTVTSTTGAIQPGALATITEPVGGANSVLYTSLTGTASAANPTALDNGGNLLFYSAPGPKICTVGGVSRTILCVAPSTGMELGFGTTRSNFVMSSSVTGVPGLSAPVVVPAGMNVFVSAELPEVVCSVGATNGFTTGIAGSSVSIFILEDGATIASSAMTIVVGGYALVRCSVPRVTTPGSHTYTVSTTATSGSTVTSYAGAAIVPYIRVTAG